MINGVNNMTTKILLVEDESTLASIIADTLSGEGFMVDVARDGIEGLEMFGREHYGVVVADVMMPRLDGFEMARRLRKLNVDVPLLFLTAKSAIDDIVEGFEIGANDYLKKPFKMLELIVRIKALLRRSAPRDAKNEVVAIGSYSFDPVEQTLAFRGGIHELTHFESRILMALAENRGGTVAASELMERVWQRDDIYKRNSLHGFIHKLRRYLRHDPAVTILNQRGIGYKLVVKDCH